MCRPVVLNLGSIEHHFIFSNTKGSVNPRMQFAAFNTFNKVKNHWCRETQGNTRLNTWVNTDIKYFYMCRGRLLWCLSWPGRHDAGRCGSVEVGKGLKCIERDKKTDA